MAMSREGIESKVTKDAFICLDKNLGKAILQFRLLKQGKND
jgi:hypothetical protein